MSRKLLEIPNWDIIRNPAGLVCTNQQQNIIITYSFHANKIFSIHSLSPLLNFITDSKSDFKDHNKIFLQRLESKVVLPPELKTHLENLPESAVSEATSEAQNSSSKKFQPESITGSDELMHWFIAAFSNDDIELVRTLFQHKNNFPERVQQYFWTAISKSLLCCFRDTDFKIHYAQQCFEFVIEQCHQHIKPEMGDTFREFQQGKVYCLTILTESFTEDRAIQLSGPLLREPSGLSTIIFPKPSRARVYATQQNKPRLLAHFLEHLSPENVNNSDTNFAALTDFRFECLDVLLQHGANFENFPGGVLKWFETAVAKANELADKEKCEQALGVIIKIREKLSTKVSEYQEEEKLQSLARTTITDFFTSWDLFIYAINTRGTLSQSLLVFFIQDIAPELIKKNRTHELPQLLTCLGKSVNEYVARDKKIKENPEFIRLVTTLLANFATTKLTDKVIGECINASFIPNFLHSPSPTRTWHSALLTNHPEILATAARNGAPGFLSLLMSLEATLPSAVFRKESTDTNPFKSEILVALENEHFDCAKILMSSFREKYDLKTLRSFVDSMGHYSPEPKDFTDLFSDIKSLVQAKQPRASQFAGSHTSATSGRGNNQSDDKGDSKPASECKLQ